MGKRLVFLVHGMGKHPEGWSRDAQEQLRDVAADYPRVHDNLDAMELIEIRYDHLFETVRRRWRDEYDAINAKIPANLGGSTFTRLVKAAGWSAGDGFLQEFAQDVFLYRFTLVGEWVRVAVAEQILSKLVATEATGEPFEWSVVGHSLGTAVVHDTLHALFTHELKNAHGGSLDPRIWRPESVILLANVSPILKSPRFNPHTSVVRPRGDGGTGCCGRLVSIDHKFDPFTRLRPFHPSAKDGWSAAELNGFTRKTPQAVFDLNVHSLPHYLGDPHAHIPILRCATGIRLLRSKIAQAERLHDEHSIKKWENQLKAKATEITNEWLESNGYPQIDEAKALFNNVFSEAGGLWNDLKGWYGE